MVPSTMAFATHAELVVFETSVNERFQGLEQRALESIGAAVSSLKEQEGTSVTEGWTYANVMFTREQSAVRALVQEMKLALEATSTEGLLQAATKIKSIDVDREAENVRLSIVLADMTTRLETIFQSVFSQVGVLEAKIPECSRGGSDYTAARPPALALLTFACLIRLDGS